MALYHKYRPQIFAEVVGQTAIIQTLTSQIRTSTFAHAYIFSGSRGSGKTSTARLLAKAINCQKRTKDSAEPCNECDTCKTITLGKHIDVIEIDAASHTGVDNVRENIIENAQFQPTFAKYKVFIIDEVHMLSNSAFNALLKTLEEPPQYVVFILATTELHKIPETILSRCQRYTFRKTPRVLLTDALQKIAEKEGITLENAVLDAIVSKADGGMRDALGLLDQMISLGQKNITREEAAVFLPLSPISDTISFLELLIKKNTLGCFEQLDTFSEQSIDMIAFLDTLIETMRLLMIAKIEGNTALDTDLNSESKEALSKYTQNISGTELVVLIDTALKRRSTIKNLPLPILALQLLVIEWAEGTATLLAPQVTTSTPPKTSALTPEKPDDRVQNSTPPSPPFTQIKQTETPASESPTPKSPVNVSLGAIQQKWGHILKNLEPKSPSLVSLLKSSHLTSLEDNTLTLEVPYKLHQDKLSQKEYKKMFEDTLAETLGTSFSFKTVIAAKEVPTTNQNDLENIAAAFGGVVF